jgi:hypothetical protein
MDEVRTSRVTVAGTAVAGGEVHGIGQPGIGEG